MEIGSMELQVLRKLAKKGRCKVEELGDLDRTMRALLWLQEKGLAKVWKETRRKIELTEEGKKVLKEGSPERRLLALLPIKVSEVPSELKHGIGPAIKLGWAKIENGLLVKVGEGENPLEIALRAVAEGNTVEESVLKELRRRKWVKVVEEHCWWAEITEKGVEAAKTEVVETVTYLTPEMLARGTWRKVKLKKYDVLAPVPKKHPGKPHPYAEFLEEIRDRLVALGFKEVKGPLVELEFWNFDCLFQAQNHPAREIHDTYWVGKDNYVLGRIHAPISLIERVRAVHENGGGSGSTGWGYKWDETVARRVILRTQTTAVSARFLASGIKPPVKMFTIDRVFRPEKIDWKHLSDFNQVEGIVADPSVSFRDLLGILREFAEEICGMEKVKFVPAYFPFTEPSVEVFGKTRGKWVEFGGAGVFRPEVTWPFEIDYPVIAWGLGMDRFAMERLGIIHIRQLFTQDLKFLRELPVRKCRPWK